MTTNLFTIDGYWKDDLTPINGYIVSSMDSVFDEDIDDYIFYYGLDEHELKQAVIDGENTALEFVIESYKPYSL